MAATVALGFLLLISMGVAIHSTWRYLTIRTSAYDRHEVVIMGPVDGVALPDAVEQTIAVLNKRLKALGVYYYQVRKAGGPDIQVFTPVSRDPRELIDLITARANLEMRREASEADTRQFTTVDGRKLTLFPLDVRCFWFKAVKGDPMSRDSRISVVSKPVITGADVERASVIQDGGSFGVRLELTADGAKRFEQWTGAHVGSRLAIIFNEEVIMAPTIEARIPGGLVEIKGAMTPNQAQETARLLNAGQMPYRLHVRDEKKTVKGLPAPPELLHIASGAGALLVASSFGLVMLGRRRGKSQSLVSPIKSPEGPTAG